MKLKELLLTRALFDMNINNRKIQAETEQTTDKDTTKRRDESRGAEAEKSF